MRLHSSMSRSLKCYFAESETSFWKRGPEQLVNFAFLP